MTRKEARRANLESHPTLRKRKILINGIEATVNVPDSLWKEFKEGKDEK